MYAAYICIFNVIIITHFPDEKDSGKRKEIPASDEIELGMTHNTFDDFHSRNNDDLFSVIKPNVKGKEANCHLTEMSTDR
jgi:hypothetical protein